MAFSLNIVQDKIIVPLITIIIPIYNRQKYIEQCINSVLSQTLKEIEVICIDDGSTDLSAEIVQELSWRDNRIRLFQQKNQGPGAARNLGIEKANGKYMTFLDADDYYVNHDALEKMYLTCEKRNIEACVSMYWEVNNKIELVEKTFHQIDDLQILNYQDFQFDYNFTNYLFLREPLVKNKIRFPDYRTYEDPPFLPKALFGLKEFAVANTCLYHYRMPEAGARFHEKNILDLLRGLIENLRFACRHNLDKLFYVTLNRLEYEYAVIIRKHTSSENLEVLKLLMEADQIVKNKCGKKRDTVRPLRLILSHMEYYERMLLKKINEENEIALYGAGKYGKLFLSYLKMQNLLSKVNSIVVSNMNGNVRELYGIPVIELEEFLRKKSIFLLITVWGAVQEEIENGLRKKNYRKYEAVNDVFLDYLSDILQE